MIHPQSPLVANQLACWAATLCALAAVFGVGWLLVPRSLCRGPRLLRVALMLASGLAFLTGAAATWFCGRLCYLSLFPILQLGLAAWHWRLPELRAAGEVGDSEPWNWRDALFSAAVVLLAAWVFQLPDLLVRPNGTVQFPHPDIGYFMEMVLALPQAKAANGWCVTLGDYAVQASGVDDQWYHWGSLFFAAGVRAVTGLPALNALMHVTNSVMNVVLILLSGAVVEHLRKRLSIVLQLVLGVLAILGMQCLRVPELTAWLMHFRSDAITPIIHASLAITFPYKFEAILALAALVSWLTGVRALAFLMLFLAAVSTPHVIASLGVAAGPLVLIGFALRKKELWLPALAVTGLLLGAWVTVHFFGVGLPKGATSSGMGLFNVGDMGDRLLGGIKDSLLCLVVGAISLPGMIHLLRSKDEEHGERLRFVGALGLTAFVGGTMAVHFLRHMPERFHAEAMTQALLVLPIGMWGLIRMAGAGSAGMRRAAMVLVACSSLMGFQSLLKPMSALMTAPWTLQDLTPFRDELQGRPVGYCFSSSDRGWWISKNGFLGGLLGSRILRINSDSAQDEKSKFYGAEAPFTLLPPQNGEHELNWSIRLMAKLDVRYLIETSEDPLPQPLRDACKLVATAPDLKLYKLPEVMVAKNVPAGSMTGDAPIIASQTTCWAVAVAVLALLFGLGQLLVPRRICAGPKLVRLAVVLASGMVFFASVSATWCCGRWMFLTVLPVLQIAAAVFWRTRSAGSDDGVYTPWTRREMLVAVIVIGVAAYLFQMPYQYRLAGGGIRMPHPDIGYYTSLVLALPEAKAANGWAVLLGEHAVAASGKLDSWYHWGSMFLAVGVRALTGLPAVNALVDVACSVTNVILILGAAAVAGCLLRLSLLRQLLVGAVSLVSVQWLVLPATTALLQRLAGSEAAAHVCFSLAFAFPYKFEAVIALAALAAWLVGRSQIAVLLLFIAGVSAPHIVGAVGVAAGPAMFAGFALRNRKLWQTSAVIVAVLLGAWGAVRLLGGGTESVSGAQSGAHDLVWLKEMVSSGSVSILVTFLFGMVSLPGIVHLIRARDEQATDGTRFLGWLALCGMVGASIGLQLLKHMPDRFHIMTMTQALIIMPIGCWGLARMAVLSTGVRRIAAGAVMAASLAMGVMSLLAPLRTDPVAPWRTSDLADIRRQLQGKPFGYLAADDRGWWITKDAFLGGLLGSRCVRINPDGKRSEHSDYYGADAPFKLVPRKDNEPVVAWCHRFIAALGIRHMMDSAANPMPGALKNRCKLLVTAGGLSLYELPDDIAAGGGADFALRK